MALTLVCNMCGNTFQRSHKGKGLKCRDCINTTQTKTTSARHDAFLSPMAKALSYTAWNDGLKIPE